MTELSTNLLQSSLFIISDICSPSYLASTISSVVEFKEDVLGIVTKYAEGHRANPDVASKALRVIHVIDATPVRAPPL